MKKIYLIITIVLVNTYACKAQLNELTRTEYYNIEINDVTFQSIYDTNGDETNMKDLFGSDLSYEFENDILISKQFWNDDFTINFDSDDGNYYYISFINIHTPSVNLKIKGITVKLGDNKSVFGNNVVMNTFKGGVNSIVFIDEDTGSVALDFKINKFTNKIIEIGFNAY